DDEISSGLAPGSERFTLTVAGSARGKRSTPRSRKEKMPSTTSDITSIVAKTGRRTQTSDSISLHSSGFSSLSQPRAPSAEPDVLLDAHLRAVDQFLDVRHGDALAGVHAAQDLDAIPHPIAHFQLAHAQLVAVDDEHAIDAVSVLQRAVREREDLVRLAALDVDARKRAGLQHGVPIRDEGLEGKSARRAVDRRADAGHFALEGPLRIRVHLELHRLAVLD